MRLENILQEVKNIVDKDDKTILLNGLIDKLEKELRLTASYKSNSNSKINAIKRICKYSEKTRPSLSGYHIADDGFYEITDGYRAYRLNKMVMPVLRVGTEKTVEEINNNTKILEYTYPDLKRVFTFYNEEENVLLDIADIMYHYSIRDSKDIKSEANYYVLKSNSYNVKVNINYLKDTFDILGKNVKCSLSGENKPVAFVNANGEHGLILPINTGRS